MCLNCSVCLSTLAEVTSDSLACYLKCCLHSLVYLIGRLLVLMFLTWLVHKSHVSLHG